MKALFKGMIVGALVVTAMRNSVFSSKNIMRKGKRMLFKKVGEMLNV